MSGELSAMPPPARRAHRYPPPRPNAVDVPQEYARLRAEEPLAPVVLPSGDAGYLVSRYEDVRAVLSDPRCSRAATVRPEAPKLTAVPFDAGGLFTMDPPEHTRLRALVSRAFTPRRVARMRPRLVQLAGSLADSLADAGPPADLNAAFAFPFPVAVICELLGVPYADRERFRTWSDAVLSLTAHTPQEMLRHKEALLAYLARLVAAKRREPGEDLLSALVTVRDEDGGLTEQELLTLAMTLLIAGHETTAGVLGTSVFTLLRHPGGMARVPDDEEELSALVEELLRINPLGDGGPLRVTTRPVEVAGHTLPANSAVIASVCSANRDGSRFPEPDRFDPGRFDPARARTGTAAGHLAFGHGPHYCLGAPLARAELAVALRTLADRFPTLRLAVPVEDVTMHTGLLVNRLTRLPVTWD
ncbi:cytochrome P450 [Streptomyces albus]|uniref:Cytochrome P450 n=1 Tax=Streptomyces albus TaxID=1888 RepID=A0A6C1C0Z9_9ACTN|nr:MULTISPECIES: cytochrome P450 [Streptomyces]QID35841.1 cytochrome P450 [Streptomyces albus]TGG89660.1 cytochrome P450 [Streptomyces albus]UVN57373.1 cytochrome P450 [Streptomyces albus]